jgi:ATP-dependent helicase HepA
MELQYAPGQRWVNHAELQMGLGTIISIEHRTITLLFPATGETRIYSKDTAPLTRVIFSAGDKIKNQDGVEILIQSVQKTDDELLIYSGIDHLKNRIQLPEINIDNMMSLHGPKDRLLAGLVDDDKWYNLRYLTLNAINYISNNPIGYITGCRTDLILHQLYIAHEVSHRYAPRVLLADEVGLGKTIEAGLIIHQQLYTEQIQRVLIIVPENLLHQWLVEMLRRFNLRFSIYDEDRYQGILESNESSNPFEEEQLVLCSLNSLTNNYNYYQHILRAGWDMLVVDEAHHLQWSPEYASNEYTAIDNLASVIKGVLLLTATPEQLGKAGHYARLRILDPDRFPNFETFIDEEKNYLPIASAVDILFNSESSVREILNELDKVLPSDLMSALNGLVCETSTTDTLRKSMINHLLDYHGTGRVLFRNTRAAVTGFPEREIHPYPLPAPQAYLQINNTTIEDKQCHLSIELAYKQSTNAAGHWTQHDPRINWLIEKIEALLPHKVLLITYDKQTAIDLAEVLRIKAGKYAALFHEDMSIIERDRAAAYFSDFDEGTQLLICSEIGSEGRNFQFSHHLVLFDLPINPDMLEQRIGRLDRIGQRHTVQIHVPYIIGTAQEFMFMWYQHGLAAFTKPCQSGQPVFNQVKNDLFKVIESRSTDSQELVNRTKELNKSLIEQMEKGRDRLLEYNSCRVDVAEEYLKDARESDKNFILSEYMETIFDCYGVHTEEHTDNSYILTPTDNMVTSFPHLPEEGLTITYARNTALLHENWHYLTWSHPMVTAAIDMVLSYETGNAAIISFKHPEFTPGTVLLESHYILESSAQQDFALRNLIAPQLIRLVIDENGLPSDITLEHDFLENTKSSVDIKTANKIISMKQKSIKNMIEKSNQLAMDIAPKLVTQSRIKTESKLTLEINRLIELSKINPNIREEEIDFYKSQQDKCRQILDTAQPRLDAVRILIST